MSDNTDNKINDNSISLLDENNQGGLDKNSYKDYTLVICSTQNQMVNYIPIKLFNIKPESVWNITVEGSDYHDNRLWDKNISKVINGLGFDNTDSSQRIIKLNQSITHNVGLVKKEIKKTID